MSIININRVTLTGNLTKDPDLSYTPSGLAVCSFRLAVNGRRKVNDVWTDDPNYFNITIFGPQGENVHKFIAKGQPVAVDGRLDWSTYTDKQNQKRQAIQIIADTVQFLSDGKKNKPQEGPQQGPAPPAEEEETKF